ncbi:MAG: lipase [Phycisphaeraceae bacterium]|nr:lipase [Phycisphaeraceae bacterium]
MSTLRQNAWLFTVLFILLASFFTQTAQAQQADGFTKKSDIFYLDMPLDKASESQQSQNRLDVIYPTDTRGFATIVWFHGGGLTGGKRHMPKVNPKHKFATVAVSYRLIPKGTYDNCLEDAASAVAWTFKHIAELGGDPNRIFVSGHSAGGYLAAMVGLDKKWLAKHEIDANQLAGIVPFSGQMTTHFRVRKERGFTGNHPVLDEYAPLWHIRKDASPFLLITGDRDMEFPGRTEENLLMNKMMQVVGHPNSTMYELQGYGHLMTAGGYPILERWVNQQLKAMNESKSQ